MLGPRYATDVRIGRQLEASTVGAQGALMRGREAAERLAWADAYAALSLADRSTPLAAEDLELLATAAYLLGHVEDCLGALQRAHQLYAEGGGSPAGRMVRRLAGVPPELSGRPRASERVVQPCQPTP